MKNAIIEIAMRMRPEFISLLLFVVVLTLIFGAPWWLVAAFGVLFGASLAAGAIQLAAKD